MLFTILLQCLVSMGIKFVKLEKQFDKPSARLTKAESLNET
jgi:hypothetical protein